MNNQNSFLNPTFSGLNPKELGTHSFTFFAALRCHKEGLTLAQAEELIAAQENCMNRPFRPNEVSDAVRSAYSLNRTKKRGPRWPSINHAKRTEVLSIGYTLETLKEKSPVPCLGPNSFADVERVVGILFPGNPLLCLAESNKVCFTKEREEWREELWLQQFIVPSPMSARYGRTLSGRFSNRCKENTGQRRFLVVEQDKVDGTVVPQDDQAGILLHLATMWPLALVCHSGGKSLHGWFYVPTGTSEEKLKVFFSYAVSLGADPALWNPSQLARLPGATRDNRKNQTIHFFNPSVIK